MHGVVSRGATGWAAGIEDGDGDPAEALAMQKQLVRVPLHEEAPIAGVPRTAPAPEETCVLRASLPLI